MQMFYSSERNYFLQHQNLVITLLKVVVDVVREKSLLMHDTANRDTGGDTENNTKKRETERLNCDTHYF